MKTKSLIILALTAVLIFASSLPAVAAGDVVVPFYGTYITNPIVGGGAPPCIIRVSITSEGEATHLGESTWDSVLCMDPRNPPPPFPQWGDMVFTAANGDQLFGSYVGFGIPNPSDGSVVFWGTYTFTGGSGRFQSVTGGTGTYQGSVVGTTGELSFNGTLVK